MVDNKLTLFFLILVVPLVVLYLEHAYVEFDAYDKAKSDYKKTKTLSEGIFFLSVALGYVILAAFIVLAPQYKIPYIILIVGTIAVVILYYMRIYGIPIPGTEIILRDMTTDWRDVTSKILQQIIVVPVSLLLANRSRA